jgi:hypothetical protein
VILIVVIEKKIEGDIGYAQFFHQFAGGRLFIGFVGQYHPAGSHIPKARVDVLAGGPSLQKQFVCLVENQNVTRLMDEPVAAHDAAGLMEDFCVLAIDYLDNLVRLDAHDFGGCAGKGGKSMFAAG